jgi:hypothetical protein
MAEASSSLARHFTAARDRIAQNGLIGCLGTARQEPLLQSICRAILDGIGHTWPTEKIPADVHDAISGLTGPEVGNQSILDAVRVLCKHAPVLLVVDEFGKSLNIWRDAGIRRRRWNVFLLQELAELGAGARGLPLYLLTLQHLSFSDYASRTTALQTREWAKIQAGSRRPHDHPSRGRR